jgi:hypothetical protein
MTTIAGLDMDFSTDALNLLQCSSKDNRGRPRGL